MKNVLEYLENTAQRYGDKVAIIEEEKKCTYNELLQKSKRVGSKLLEVAFPREPVAILMDKGINSLFAFFGTIYAGGFYVLLNPELPIERLKKILEVLEAGVIITDQSNMKFAEEISDNATILKIEEIQESKIDDIKLESIRRQAMDIDPLYANFTSGSTGVPKGVVVSHRSVIDFINVFTDKFEITEKDIIGNQAPFDFDVSVKDIYSSIKTGATLVIIPRKFFMAPTKLLDYITENNTTTLIWAVSALCLITTFHGLEYKTPKTINKVMFSGEIMPIKHIRQWINYLPNAMYVNLYGPTEITCNCAYHILENSLPYEKQIPTGQAFDNEQIILLDEDNEEITEKNKVGEICVKGTALALGYYNNMDKTREQFIQNPLNNKYLDMIYKTGDLGYIGDDNNLYFSGRKDFQIKHQGHRIELEEIQIAMEKIDNIKRACCLYHEEKSKIYAFYIGDVTRQEIHNELKKTLPIFMIPNVLVQIEEFPMTKNGKIDRNKLKEMMKKQGERNERSFKKNN